MMTYLPIFSGNDPRPAWAFARLLERVLVKVTQALGTSFDFDAARILGRLTLNCDLGRGLGEVVVTYDAGHEILAIEGPGHTRSGTQFTNRGQR